MCSSNSQVNLHCSLVRLKTTIFATPNSNPV